VTTDTTTSALRRLPSAVLAGAVAVLAAGAAVVVATGSEPQASRPAPAAPAAGQQVAGGARLQTSFGAVTVDYVNRLVGARRPMGVRVPAGHLAVQVGVTVTNLGRRPFRVDGSVLELERAVGGGIYAGPRAVGRVPALTAQRFVLRHAVPRRDSLPQLVVRDPDGRAPMRVALGDVENLDTLNVATHEFGGPVR
jgi:hypothetical protein